MAAPHCCTPGQPRPDAMKAHVPISTWDRRSGPSRAERGSYEGFPASWAALRSWSAIDPQPSKPWVAGASPAGHAGCFRQLRESARGGLCGLRRPRPRYPTPRSPHPPWQSEQGAHLAVLSAANSQDSGVLGRSEGRLSHDRHKAHERFPLFVRCMVRLSRISARDRSTSHLHIAPW